MKAHQLLAAPHTREDFKLRLTETVKETLRHLVKTFRAERSDDTFIELNGTSSGPRLFKINLQFRSNDREYIQLVKSLTLKHAQALIDRQISGLKPWDDDEMYPKWESRRPDDHSFYLVGNMPESLSKKFSGFIHVTANDI